MVLTPIEAEVLTNVTEDLCTLAELQDRADLLGLAQPHHTFVATEVLERHGLIERWAGRRSALYRTTAAGVIALAEHRRRARLVRLTLSTRAAA